MYAGDSGNDRDALVMDCRAVVVNNARLEFKKELKSIVREKGIEGKIYFAHGDYGCDEGNHVRGVIEGAIHHDGFIKKELKRLF